MLSFDPLDTLLVPVSIIHLWPQVSKCASRDFLVSISVHSTTPAVLHSASHISFLEDPALQSLSLDCILQMIEFIGVFLQFLQPVTSWFLQRSHAFLNSLSCYWLRIWNWNFHNSVSLLLCCIFQYLSQWGVLVPLLLCLSYISICDSHINNYHVSSVASQNQFPP